MCYTYILLLSNHKHYTGISQNLYHRFDQHQKGQSKSTRRHLPVKLLWSYESNTRQEARTLEVKIKKRGAKRFLLDLCMKTIYTSTS